MELHFLGTAFSTYRSPKNPNPWIFALQPSGKQERSILCGIGSPYTGLTENCIFLFRGSKTNKKPDYHSEMNWNVFSNWCKAVVLPTVTATEKKSAVVLDSAICRTVLDEEDKRPVRSWSTDHLVQAIHKWGGAPDDWPLTWATRKYKNQLIDCGRQITRLRNTKSGKLQTSSLLNTFRLIYYFYLRLILS